MLYGRSTRRRTSWPSNCCAWPKAGKNPLSYWRIIWRWGPACSTRETSPLPAAIGAIDDFDLRYYTIARILLEENISLLMALNPSTILLLLQKLDDENQPPDWMVNVDGNKDLVRDDVELMIFLIELVL